MPRRFALPKRLESQNGGSVLQRLRERSEWRFFGLLPTADPPLAGARWLVIAGGDHCRVA
jgi:hypothetical protein